MAIQHRTITVIVCDSCGREITGSPLTWWEKDGEKSLRPVEGWKELHNCGSCLTDGYAIAEVMG